VLTVNVNRLNIAARIWLSIGIFILGFLISMGLQQVQGIETEKTLRITSEVLFPSAQMSQSAEAAFYRAIKNFSDAVLVQDSGGLRHAEEEGFNAVENLRAMAAIRGLAPERSRHVMKLAGSIGQFLVDARGTYGIVLSSPATLSQETQERMRRLAYRTDVLKASLKSTKDRFSSDMHGQLAVVRARSAQQRWVAALVFGFTLIIAGALVNLTIRGYIIAPIQRADAELTAARDKAECASLAKGEFLANMSHEIRTPMNGILGMTELALEAAVNSEQRECLRTVKESADALMSILNDILDFSKIEAGKLELNPIEFDLTDCVSDCLRLLAVRAAEKRIDLAVDIRPDVPERLIADPGRLRQILMNLVGNALKFTERGGVTVQVSLQESNGTVHTLHFMIADTGIGVPADKQAKIFAAFEQADGSTTRRYGGTGLGLAISVKLVELMKGRIWMESPWTSEWPTEGGPGSAFHFTAQLEAGTWRTRVLEPAALEGLAVLVVDDNLTNRLILTETLSNWGMKPCCADSGNAALAALAAAHKDAKPFGLVVLDGQMPEMDGFTTAETIRQHPEYAATRIVMLTSSDNWGDGVRCAQVDIQGYLPKPAKSSELFVAIRTVMGTNSETPASTPLVTRDSVREARKNLKVLVAEDNKVNQRLALRLLEKLGHSVELANNGREAVDMLNHGVFDVVLMDLQMPELGGLEATAVIREREKRTGSHVPIYALTAHAMKGDRERCLKAGMDGYISKPIQSQELYKLLDAVKGFHA
jgi:two-component system sensor histidine kinase/response regulator